MYDSIGILLKQSDFSNTNFLSETTNHFNVTGEHKYSNGGYFLSGDLGNFTISVSDKRLIIKNGSLCKYHFGNNFETLKRKDVECTIENLSDTLHLPIDKGIITRLDVAHNFTLNEPVEVYCDYLGTKEHSTRLPVNDKRNKIEGIYYIQNDGLGECLFYNKVKEQGKKNTPDLLKDKNVLRYEQRFFGKLSKTFKVECVTASMLYEKIFFKTTIDRWVENYNSIKKILVRNTLNINDVDITTLTELRTVALLSYIQENGGELAMLQNIKEKQKMGKLTDRQAYNFREEINRVCQITIEYESINDTIYELDKKVYEAVEYYKQAI